MENRDGKARVVPATRGHALALAGDVGRDDALDLERGWGHTPLEAATESLRQSDGGCWAIVTARDEVAAMFGAAGDGNIWMMTGKAFDRHVALRFVRESGPYIDALLGKYGRLYGTINANNVKMTRWLLRSGFRINDLGNGYAGFEKCAAR
jgi:hypothetical protein